VVTRAGVRRAARGRRGAGAMGCLLPLLILAIIGYVGVHASDSALNYYRLRDAMRQEARFAHRKTDDQIRIRLRAFVDSMAMPVAARKINIQRSETRISISADYQETIDFPLFPKRFDFHPNAERRF